jgi:cysteine desulfurase
VTEAQHPPVYLDNHSTTRTDPRVIEAMLPYFGEHYGNAHSRSHTFGWAAEKAVDDARANVAGLLGARDSEIIFTSGGTEACNLAILGVAKMYGSKGKHIVTTAVEHRSVMDPLRALERDGYDITYLPVDTEGRVTAEQVEEAIREDTILVAVIFANNEIGSINPAGAIGKVCKDKGVIYFLDACLGLDTEDIDVERDGIDLLAISGHKIYGPKGIGALYVRRRRPRVRLSAQMLGGGQERGFRHGTLNVPGIVGMGKAAALCTEERASEKERLTRLSNKMKSRIWNELDYVFLNGHDTERIPGGLNISFNYVEGESMMMGMTTICVSSGSACTSATLEPSHVMRAIGVGEDLVHTSIRFSLGRFTTEEEVDYATEQTIASALKLREMSPLYEMVKEGVDLNTIEWHHD